MSDEGPGAAVAKRTVYRAGALVVLGVSAISALEASSPRLVLGLHVLWAGHIAIVGELVGRGRLTTRSGGVISSCGGVVLLPAILLATGQPVESLLYMALLCMPLIVAALAPDDRGSVLVFGFGGLGWTMAIETMAGLPALRVAARAAFSVVNSAIAVVATVNFQRVQAARHRAVEERMAALQQLADSEKRRADSERLVVLGQLSAGVAHEINNPLAYVTANLDCIREHAAARGVTDHELRECLDDAANGLERIRLIVRDLGDLGRPDERPCINGCKPAAAVQEALRLTAARLRTLAQVENLVPDLAPGMLISHQRLVRLLVNLLLNAADAVEAHPGSGPHQLRVLAEPASEGRLRIVVEDSGPGIPPAILHRVFDPFFTTKDPGKGTGLGLALVREYAERAAGSVRAENRPEGGARFCVELPCVANA